jgi:amino acid transporter
VFFYLICTVVTIDTIGAVASNGAQGFTWLIFLGVFFFLPYALSVAELGSAFPQEGGPYVWSRLAFGRPLAVIVGVGVVFYLLGGKTRREAAAEPVAPAYVLADDHEPAS